MPLVSMRQLLDHAAEHDYGLPAFNVNNLEQVQAIMEAAAETDSPVIMQASAGARKYAGETFLRHLIEAAVESYPNIPVVMHQDHGQSPDVCLQAMRLGFSSVMMDGSLMADGKSIASYEYNIDVTKQVVGMAHAIGVTVEGELGCLGSLETMKGDKEDGHGAEGTMTREMLLTDPDQAADFVKATAARRAGDRHRHLARRLQVHAQAHGRHPRDRPDQGDPRAHPEHAPRDARQLVGAAGPAADHPRQRRRDEGNLRRPGRRDPRRHQARRAQDQHRHRHPARDDGGDPQVPEREEERLRSARLPEARARSGEAAICKQRYEQFGCAGMGSTIKPVPLDKVATRYQSGELAAGRQLAGLWLTCRGAGRGERQRQRLQHVAGAGILDKGDDRRRAAGLGRAAAN